MRPHKALLRQATRFACVGVVNTGLHLAVAVAAVEWAAWPPVLANGCAFCVASAFSFWANSRYTFAATPTLRRYLRFALVSVLGLWASLAASALAQALQWHYLYGVALSFGLLPMLSFAASKWWTWSSSDP